MERTPASNRFVALLVGLVGVFAVVYPFVGDSMGMSSIGVVSLGALLIVVALVLASGSPPHERDLHNRGF